MEFYERYQKFERRETNPLIDEPLNFFRGLTKGEVFVGVMMFVAAIYISSLSIILMLLFAALSVAAPLFMQHLRTLLPKNYFVHLMWFFGLWRSEYREFKRPNNNYLTL